MTTKEKEVSVKKDKKRPNSSKAQLQQQLGTKTAGASDKYNKNMFRESKIKDEAVVEEDGLDEEQAPEAKKARKEVRQEQKALTKERRQHRPHADVVGQLRPLWETIRQKNVPLEAKQEPIAKALELMRGLAQELAVKGDASRIMQSIITYASTEQRVQLAGEFKLLYKSACDEHAVHVLKKFVSDCASSRQVLVSNLKGHLERFIKSRTACSFLDQLYRRLNSTSKMMLIAEIFSREYVTLDVPRGVLSIKDLLKQNPAKREVVLENLRTIVPHLLNKQVLDFIIVQRLIDDYLQIEIPSKLVEKTESFLEHLEAMLESPIGCTALVRIIAASGAKERKVIVKTLKDHLHKLIFTSHMVPVLAAILCYVDDTVLVGKAILQGVSSFLPDMIHDKSASRLIFLLLAGRQDKYITPGLASLLKECDPLASTTSKKEPSVRHAELLEYFLSDLSVYFDEHLLSAARNISVVPILVEFFNVIPEKKANLLLDQIIDESDGVTKMLESPATDLFIRSIVKLSPSLADIVYEMLAQDFVETLKQPSGFLFAVMLRHPNIFSKIEAHVELIRQVNSEPAQTLLKKLAEGPTDNRDK